MFATKYDLRKYENAVDNQGPYQTCFQNALTSSIEMIMKQAGADVGQLSRMQNYYDTRVYQGDEAVDAGSIGAAAILAATRTGFAPESAWDYSQGHLFAKPTDAVYAAATVKVMSDDFMPVYRNVADIRDWVLDHLSEGKSVVVAMHLRQYFKYQSGPLAQQDSDGKGASYGGHAVEIVGWDGSLNGGSYIVKNSYGPLWGDQGYGSISYKQFDFSNNSDLISMHSVTGVSVAGKEYDFTFSALRETVAEQYTTILGRAADIAGMNWYTDKAQAMVESEWQLAESLIHSAEGNALYGSLNNSQFVSQVYHNVLGRSADAGGLEFYTKALDSGLERGKLFAGFLDSLEDPAAETHELFANRVNMSMNITITHQYDGQYNAQVAALLAQVTANDNTLEVLKIGIPTEWSV